MIMIMIRMIAVIMMVTLAGSMVGVRDMKWTQ